MRQHQIDMEKSFAVARSKDKACGICMETIWEKLPSTKQRFGLLPNCSHCFWYVSSLVFSLYFCRASIHLSYKSSHGLFDIASSVFIFLSLFYPTCHFEDWLSLYV